MSPVDKANATARLFRRASIVNSLLLLPTAALQLNVTFWVLVVTNFALMHAVWFVQVARRGERSAVDWRFFRSPLIAFAVLGNAAVLLWGDRLFSAFVV